MILKKKKERKKAGEEASASKKKKVRETIYTALKAATITAVGLSGIKIVSSKQKSPKFKIKTH